MKIEEVVTSKFEDVSLGQAYSYAGEPYILVRNLSGKEFQVNLLTNIVSDKLPNKRETVIIFPNATWYLTGKGKK